MTARPLACPKCRAELPGQLAELAGLQSCPACATGLEITAFPALERAPVAGATGELVVVDGEASCFHHPNKRAVVPCSACGRFLCALCDVAVEDHHYCAGCLEKGARQGTIRALERSRTRYDNIALSLVTVPFLFSCAMLLTAPAALYVVIRYWNAPASLVHRSRWRLIVCGVVAVVEFCAILAFVIFMFRNES